MKLRIFRCHDSLCQADGKPWHLVEVSDRCTDLYYHVARYATHTEAADDLDRAFSVAGPRST